jgi:fermentation-respiration switch protein FrsA (DUF1100 family)
MKQSIRKSIFFGLILVGLFLMNQAQAQCNCTGCTQTINTSSSANITANSGDVICIGANAVISGTVTVNQGGKVCNAGTITGDITLGYMSDMCNDGKIDVLNLNVGTHAHFTSWGTVIVGNNVFPEKSGLILSYGCIHFKKGFTAPVTASAVYTTFLGPTFIDGDVNIGGNVQIIVSNYLEVKGKIIVGSAGSLTINAGSCVKAASIDLSSNGFINGPGPGYGQLVVSGSTTSSGNGAYRGKLDVCLSYAPGTKPNAVAWDASVTYCINNNVCTAQPCETPACTLPTVAVATGSKKFNCVTGAITIAGTTSSGGTSQTWTSTGAGTFDNNGNLNPVYTPNTSDLNQSSIKLYITVTNACGSVKDSVILNFPPQITATPTDPICAGNTGSITSTATKGTGPYTYSWSSGQTTANITGLPGTYTVAVTDANGCTKTTTATINTATTPGASVATAAPKKLNCVTGAITISGTIASNNTSQTWTSTGTGTFSNNGILNPTFTPSAADLLKSSVTLYINVTGTCGTAKDSVILNFPPKITATATDPTCSVPGSVSSSATNGTTPYTYSWNSGQTTANISGVAPGTYSVTVTDKNGCTYSSSATVNSSITAAPTVATTTKKVNCVTGAVTISGTTSSNSTSQTWSSTGTGTFSNNGILNPTFTPSTADLLKSSVTLYINVTGTCGTAKDSVVLNFPPKITATATDPTCSTPGSVSSSATNGTTPYTYSWNSGQTTATISGVAPGTYSVTVTDKNGCTYSSNATVNSSTTAAPTVATTTKKVNCVTGAVTITGTTSSNTTSQGWTTSGSGTFNNNSTLNPIYTPSPSDLLKTSITLYITVTGACGTAKDSVVLNFPPKITATATDPTCSTPGSVSSSATNGTAPYTYSWSGGQTTANIFGVPPGTFTVTLTDKNGCTSTSTATVNATTTAAPTVATTTKKVNCVTGAVTISGTTSSNNTSQVWTSTGTGTFSNNGVLNPTFTPSAADLLKPSLTLYINVTGTCGTAKDSVVLNFPPKIIATATDPTCSAPGSVSSSATNGTSPYTYLWNSGQTTATISGVAPGTYSVTVTDKNGCTYSSSATVNSSTTAAPTVATTTKKVNCVTGAVTISGTTSSNNTSQIWTSNGGGTFSNNGAMNPTYTPSASDLLKTSVTLYISVSGTCGTAKDSVVLNFPPKITAAATDPTCSTPGSVSSSASNGTAPYTYLWSSGQTTASISGVAPGSYTVSVTDKNGCISTSSATINSTTTAAPTVSTLTKKVNCVTGAITITGTSASYNNTQTWTSTGSGTFNNTGILNPVYTPSVSDLQKSSVTLYINVTGTCGTAKDSVVLRFPFQLGTSVTGPDCFIDGTVNTTVTGGTGPYVYSWSNGQTTSSISGLTMPGIYTVTVTDANNCSKTSTATVKASVRHPVIRQSHDTLYVDPAPASGYYFQWFLNGAQIPTGIKSYYVFTQSGSYSVNISDGSETGCSGTSDPLPVYTTGLLATSQKIFKVNVIPNPNNGQFSLYIDTDKKATVTIELYDMIGKQIYKAEKMVNGTDKIDLNISEYPKGIYLLNVRDSQHSSAIRVISQ